MRKVFFLLTLILINNSVQAQTDEYLWLEDINGQKSIEFVKAQSKITYDKFSQEKSYQSFNSHFNGQYSGRRKITEVTFKSLGEFSDFSLIDDH